jgi:hypothetical protein
LDQAGGMLLARWGWTWAKGRALQKLRLAWGARQRRPCQASSMLCSARVDLGGTGTARTHLFRSVQTSSRCVPPNGRSMIMCQHGAGAAHTTQGCDRWWSDGRLCCAAARMVRVMRNGRRPRLHDPNNRRVFSTCLASHTLGPSRGRLTSSPIRPSSLTVCPAARAAGPLRTPEQLSGILFFAQGMPYLR